MINGINIGEMILLKKILFLYIILFVTGSMLFSDEFPKLMYVSSKEGLNQRETPFINSRKIGTFLYAANVIIIERGEETTIDGIINYWYKCYGSNGECWIFGGYLTEEMPLDVPTILGRWYVENNNRRYFIFNPNYTYGEGYKETDRGSAGKWSLNGNILTLKITQDGPDALNESQFLTTIRLIINNRNSVILDLSNGKSINLTRTNDAW